MQWRQKLENFEGDGDENSGVKGLPPQNLISFGPFIYCLWMDIFAMFLIFLSFSIFFSPIFSSSSEFQGGGKTGTNSQYNRISSWNIIRIC